jgi:hypothetical protein
MPSVSPIATLVAQAADGGEQAVLGGEANGEVIHHEESIVAGGVLELPLDVLALRVGHESLTLGSRML